MAGNVKDRNLAFQAAESALTLAESWINAQIGKPVFPNTGSGLYLPDNGVSGDPDSVDNWNENIWTGSNVVTYPNTPGASGSGTLGKINTQPKYIIEDMGETQESGGSVVQTSNYKSKGHHGAADHRPRHGWHRRRRGHGAVHLWTRVLDRNIEGARNEQTRSDIIRQFDTGPNVRRPCRFRGGKDFRRAACGAAGGRPWRRSCGTAHLNQLSAISDCPGAVEYLISDR